jgi:RHS repeat-associated protein
LTTQGYTGDGTGQKFTQKERDNETGLDYFGARYYSSIQGRFTGPDDFLKDSHTSEPASWNKYAYVRNNPLKLIDPQGEKAEVTIVTDEEHKTGRVIVKTSIAIWTADGKISQKAMEQAKNDIKTKIERMWKGEFSRDGIKYTLTTEVTSVEVYKDKNAAMSSGSLNVFEM